jgi:hypothetical protein
LIAADEGTEEETIQSSLADRLGGHSESREHRHS